MSDYTSSSIQQPEELEPESQPFEPSAVQLARAAALKRYNWFSIYLPLIIVGLLILAMAVWMVWGTIVNPDLVNNRPQFVSALADIVIIFAIFPFIIGCLLLPIGAIALLAYDRQRERTRIASFQRLLWRIDGVFETIRQKVEQLSPKVARPIIQANSWIAFFVRVWQRLKKIIWG